MQRLRHRDQIGCGFREPALFRGRDAVCHAIVWLCIRDLLFARVCRDDVLEEFTECDGSLAVAGCTIPGAFSIDRNAGKIRKQLARIMRAVFRIIARVI